MIVRIARFNTLSPEGREWITETLRGVPGVRSSYHASKPGSPGYVSVSVFDDETALQAAHEAITQRRLALGHEGARPDEVEVFAVDHFIENSPSSLHSPPG